MKVILASPRGFCAGVNMAIETLELALKLYGAPVYVYHEIVHNKHVVERFRQLGAVFVEDLQQVPAKSHLLYSAHGVAPGVRQLAIERQLKTIDATCPLVTKVHLEAIRYALAGYRIVLIGHHGHDEVIGTMGEAPEAIVLVESTEDVDRLNFDPAAPGDGLVAADKLAYLTQTTLSVDDANRIIARLKERFPSIVGPPKEDICYATQNRQEAVRELSRDANVVLVLGSQNSSNSQRLAELARETGVTAHLIDGVGRHRSGLVRRSRYGVGHRRRQRAGIGRERVRRFLRGPLRSHGRSTFAPLRRRLFSSAPRAAIGRQVAGGDRPVASPAESYGRAAYGRSRPRTLRPGAQLFHPRLEPRENLDVARMGRNQCRP